MLYSFSVLALKPPQWHDDAHHSQFNKPHSTQHNEMAMPVSAGDRDGHVSIAGGFFFQPQNRPQRWSTVRLFYFYFFLLYSFFVLALQPPQWHDDAHHSQGIETVISWSTGNRLERNDISFKVIFLWWVRKCLISIIILWEVLEYERHNVNHDCLPNKDM